MQLKVLKALWGDAEARATEIDLRRIKAAGYDGIEFGKPDADPAQWRDWCGEIGLDFVGMVFVDEPEQIGSALEEIVAYGPIHITMHSGRDKMTFEEGCRFFETALQAERQFGVPIAHETHRHRLLYCPWSTVRYLEPFPGLRICADLSHWCCVCESLLKDMEDWVSLACSRAIHIHGRVGWEEGPQVADPRAPEVAHYVERHEQWWDRIREQRREAGADAITFNPEYGPPGYMPSVPFTRSPITNLWDICLWSAERIRRRWSD